MLTYTYTARHATHISLTHIYARNLDLVTYYTKTTFATLRVEVNKQEVVNMYRSILVPIDISETDLTRHVVPQVQAHAKTAKVHF